MAINILKDEFRLVNFLYRHKDETDFLKCQWKWPTCVYLAIRLVLALYTTYGFIHELVHYYDVADRPQHERNLTDALSTDSHPLRGSLSENTTAKTHFDQWDSHRPWFVFFTLWSYMVLLVHLWVAAALSISFHYRVCDGDHSILLEERGSCALKSEEQKIESQDNPSFHVDIFWTSEGHATGSNSSVGQVEEQETGESHSNSKKIDENQTLNSFSSDRLPMLRWHFQLSWVLSDIITVCAPLVTTIFFLALYKGGPVDLFNTNVHILNVVFVFIDQLVSARPIKLLHVVAPTLFGCVYAMFSFIFWTSDHVNHVVYPGVIDWNNPGQALINTAALAFIAAPFVNTLWFLFYRLKVWLHGKLYNP